MRIRRESETWYRSWTKFALSIATTLLLASQVNADVTYSNLGPNDDFGGGATILIGNFNDTTTNSHYANQFTAQVTGFVSTVDVAVSLSDPGLDDSLLISLWTDSGNLPGASIWSGTVKPRFVSEVLSVSSNSGTVELIAGQTYWISARADDGTGTYLWYGNSQGASGRFTFDGQGGTNWNPPNSFAQQAFRVNVSNVPEPASLPLIALACGAFFRRNRKRR